MNRLLICGLAPLPFECAEKNYGPGIRTWQFARSLAEDGHSVSLLAMTIDDAYSEQEPRLREEVCGVQFERVSRAREP